MKGMNREILRLALPSILANITVPLVGMVDIAVAGHLDGGAALFIGAISVGSMLFDMLYWNFAFLRAGTGGLTAQAWGRGDMRACARYLVRAVGLALLMAALVLLLQLPYVGLCLKLVKGSPGVVGLARNYFLLRVWAAPATVSLMAFRGWFIGMQDTMSSMITDLIVNTVNIVASIVLSLGAGGWQGMGFAGIAAGTVIAQYSGLAFALGRVAFKYGRLFRGFGGEDLRAALDHREMRSFMTLNSDLFLRSLGITAIYIGFTVISAQYGEMMLACSAIIMKLLLLFSYFTDGFAYAAQALCGRYIGARDPSGTRAAVNGIFAWSMGIGMFFILLYWALGTPLLRLMTSDGAVVEAARQFLPWLMLMPPVGCAAFAWDGIYEGATAARSMRNAMFGSMLGFFGLWWLLKATLLGNAGQPDGITGLAGADGAAAVADYNALAIHCLLAAYFAHLAIRTIWLWVTCRRDILTRPFA